MRISQASYSAPAWPRSQQFLQQDGDLLPVRRGQGIELQRMPADRQCLLVGGAPAIGRLMLENWPPLG
jgi:hypothetical protein